MKTSRRNFPQRLSTGSLAALAIPSLASEDDRSETLRQPRYRSVRISPHIYNTVEDIDRVVEGLVKSV